AGELLDAEAIISIRTDLERRGVASPRQTRRLTQPSQPEATGAEPTEPNGLATSSTSNNPAATANGAEHGYLPVVQAADSLPGFETAAMLLADTDEATFQALLQLLDAAVARRLRYEEVRRILLQHRRARLGKASGREAPQGS